MTLPVEKQQRYTLEEYFEIEQGSEERFEYRDGFVVSMGEAQAMAGGAEMHSLIIANVVRALGNKLEGGPCRVYESNLRVRIPRKTLYAYPDTTVICGKTELDPTSRVGQTVLNPRVIVEVLSPATELYDRTEKFSRYREIPSLEEYVLISQRSATVETYFRQTDGTWVFGAFSGLDAVAKIRDLKIELPMTSIFAGVEFPPEAPMLASSPS